MIRNDVEQLAQPGRTQGANHLGVAGRATQVGADVVGVDDVVAMGAPGHRLQVGRAVEMTDTELGEIVGDPGRVVEAEPGM